MISIVTNSINEEFNIIHRDSGAFDGQEVNGKR